MPDTLSLSTGVSLGLLAGIVSGVCYMVANGFAWPRLEDDRPTRKLTSTSDQGICTRCGGDRLGGAVPCICIYHKPVKFESGAWFLRQVQRAASLMPWSISTEKLEQIEEEECEPEGAGPSDRHHAELMKIREFLEVLATKLAGGPLEGTRVAPIYNHPAYLPNHRKSSESSTSNVHVTSASSAHVQLKRLVARVVEEAAALPALARYATEPSPSPTLESSTYEDLLASAILNKVIERYQQENGSGGRSSGIHSASASPTPSERSSPRSHTSRPRDISPPIREIEEDVSDWDEGEATDETIELPRRVPFPEFGGDIVHQSESVERDFDEVSSSDIQAVDGSWEENWLFQKKKIKTIQSVPVPMLVPNSNTDYRALIGDRDADDTTDLSDNASDAEDQEVEFKSDMKKVLDSKHVIGGKPRVESAMDFEPDSLMIIDGVDDYEKLDENEYAQQKINDVYNEEMRDNINHFANSNGNVDDNLENDNESILIVDINNGPIQRPEFNLKEEIRRTVLNGNIDFDQEQPLSVVSEVKDVNNEANKDSKGTLGRQQREGEYEETVTVPVQRYADSLRRQHFEDEPQQIPTRDTDQDDGLIPGSIAYRERQKWLNYVEMPNNPYSPEAIQKRLSNKSTSSLFDTLTAKSKNLEDENITTEYDAVDGAYDIENDAHHKDDTPFRDSIEDDTRSEISTDNDNSLANGLRSKSASPRILKDIIAEEIPQYKRYGRDYYIREAKKSSGSRKMGTFSDTNSVSSLNKSMSLDNFESEFHSPVSASSSLSSLEAAALHHSLSRAVLSPRNASPNFAINPIFESFDKRNDGEFHPQIESTRSKNVRQQYKTVCDDGDGYVENEDIVRLKIPNVPEITEDLFQSYTDVRRSNTLKSEDSYVRSKQRAPLNYTFGGSLRLARPLRTQLW